MSVSHGVVVPGPVANEIEVMATATRRRFSAEYEVKILWEAEVCSPSRGSGGAEPPVTVGEQTTELHAKFYRGLSHSC